MTVAAAEQDRVEALPELLARCADGSDPGAEAELAGVVAIVHPQLWRFARTMLDSPEAVDEVVQETWAVALTGLSGFEGRSSVLTWLLAVVRNVARRHRTRAQERRDREAELAGPDHDAPFDAVEELAGRLHHHGPHAGHWSHPPTTRLLPEDHVLSAERRAHLTALVTALPVRQQQVLVLRDVVGLNSAEVSEVLGLTATNQRTLLFRARFRLRALLEAEATTRTPARTGGPR